MPTVWLTFRIYFVGDMPDASGIDIASQLMWVSLLYEIFQEALVVPLFFILGVSADDRSEFARKVRGGLIIVASVYLVFAAFVCLSADWLVSVMGQNQELAAATAEYVRLETVAALFSTLFKFLTITLVTLHRDSAMYLLLVVQMVLTVATDSFLISSLPFSLDLGVNGIAYSNMIVNAALAVMALAMLQREGYRIVGGGRTSFGWAREWFRVGAYSGAESFLRNIVFMLMVVRMVNLVAEQGDYWIANNFIWNWLLVPFIALGDVVKKQVAESRDNISAKTPGYVCVTVVLLAVMYATVPAWPWFIENVMNTDHYREVFSICIAMLVPYTTYVFNNIMDSTFSGTGNTQYLLAQSVCIDGVYYSVVFVLYSLGLFSMTMPAILAMFGIGMMLDLIPATILYRRLLRKEGQRVRILDGIGTRP